MSNATRNKISAQIIKAEMLGDTEKVERLKAELASTTTTLPASSSTGSTIRNQKQPPKKNTSHDKVKKFIDSTSSLSAMFEQEKSLTAADEARMFVKTSAKFSRDDMETKYFSEEKDNSEWILNKRKRHKHETQAPQRDVHMDQDICDKCLERQPKHLVIDKTDFTYLTLADAKPFLSTMSNVVIRNCDHSCNSLVSASSEHQNEVEKYMNILREAWKSKGYKCIFMETFYKDKRPSNREFTSCGKHFQVHCLPVKEKHYERARMYFKQALLESGREWSMNKKLIITDGRKIQRYLPRSLSYFWVCFDDLTNGFGHVIEKVDEFSAYFGLEVLSGMLDKDFNPMKLDDREEFKEQFERCRDFKLLYANFRNLDIM